MSYPVIQLKAGREASTGFRHPWIFSGAIERWPRDISSGDLVSVADRAGRIIGTGTYSPHGAIAVRVFDFKDTEITKTWIAARLKSALQKRILLGFGSGTNTTGFRVVFGEADGLPGLVIDGYEEVLVLQISTAGMEKLKPLVLEAAAEIFQPRAIVERSDMPGRSEEGLAEASGVLSGNIAGPVPFKENGIALLADVLQGQKTGAYLDQRDLRQLVKRFADGKKILNLFSYTGAAAMAALAGGAVSVHNVDESEHALNLVAKQAELNGFAADRYSTEAADVFSWFDTHREDEYDLVLVDPPALTKSARDKEAAGKAYHFLNRAAMRQIKDGGILITSSCSHFFDAADLAFVLRRAAVQASVKLSVLATARQALDHPESVYFAESLYLKSFVCLVEKM